MGAAVKRETREPCAIRRSAYALFIWHGFFLALTRVSVDLDTVFPASEDRRTLCAGINGALNFSQVLLPALAGLFIDTLGFPTTSFVVAASVVLASALPGGPARTIPALME
jgi:hypothetical protein